MSRGSLVFALFLLAAAVPVADPGVREVRSASYGGDVYRAILGTADRNAYVGLERLSSMDNRLIAQERWSELVVGDVRIPAAAVTAIEALTVESERLLLFRVATGKGPVSCRVVTTNQAFQRPLCETAGTERATPASNN